MLGSEDSWAFPNLMDWFEVDRCCFPDRRRRRVHKHADTETFHYSNPGVFCALGDEWTALQLFSSHEGIANSHMNNALVNYQVSRMKFCFVSYAAEAFEIHSLSEESSVWNVQYCIMCDYL